jgi:hypothetical protein
MDVELAVMAVIDDALVPEVTAVMLDYKVESIFKFGN